MLIVFSQLFALQRDYRSPFEILITFNAILYCKGFGTYYLFYRTDHRENNRLKASKELGYSNCYIIKDLDGRMLKAPPLIPWTYISRSSNIDYIS